MVFDWLKKWMGSGPGENGDGDAPEAVSCEEALSKLYEFLDGELEDPSRERVEEHFRVCARCYPRLAMEKNFREALRRAIEDGEAPKELKNRVLQLLEEEARED